MDKDLAKAIVTAIEDNGEEATLHNDYSGRGMYGETTYAVSCSSLNTALTAIICNAHSFVENDNPKFDNICNGFASDNLGRDVIIY